MNSERESRPEQIECFPIRTVAAMTGISTVTLRAWERRYGLVEPARTESGHRLYTGEDVRLIRRVVQFLERGVPIGRVAALLAEGLDDDQVEALSNDPPARSAVEIAAGVDADWNRQQRGMRLAISAFDEPRLNEIYNEALSLQPVDLVNERLVMPTLRALGEQWRERSAGIAEEHFFTTFLRNKLGARFHHLSARATGPRLVAACMPEERHELGLLMFCLAASQHGYRVVMLGQSMPTPALRPAIASAQASGLVLSCSCNPSANALKELARMVAGVEVPVFLGGAVEAAGARALQAIGVTFVGRNFGPALEQIDQCLNSAGGRPQC